MSNISFPEKYLPVLTRAAYWWLMLIGLLHLLAAAYFFLVALLSDGAWVIFPVVLSFAAGYIASAVLLCVKKRTAWVASVAILSVMLISVIALSLVYLNMGLSKTALGMLIILVMIFIPFIAIILNRKKYLAMIRQQELADSTTPAVEP